MKYNYLPRIICVLLAMVMISTIGVGYTFSKYVVDSRADDNARVTKFGVTAVIEAGAFSDTYKSPDGTLTTVDSIDTAKVLAPGTEGTFSGINVHGSPEVAVKFLITADLDLGDNWVAGGGYYCPITVTVNGTDYCGLDYASADAFEAAVEAAITLINDQVYAPGTNLAEIPGLNGDYSWFWTFRADGVKQTVEKDTELGDNAAAGNPAELSLAVTVKVEQVD